MFRPTPRLFGKSASPRYNVDLLSKHSTDSPFDFDQEEFDGDYLLNQIESDAGSPQLPNDAPRRKPRGGRRGSKSSASVKKSSAKSKSVSKNNRKPKGNGSVRTPLSPLAPNEKSSRPKKKSKNSGKAPDASTAAFPCPPSPAASKRQRKKLKLTPSPSKAKSRLTHKRSSSSSSTRDNSASNAANPGEAPDTSDAAMSDECEMPPTPASDCAPPNHGGCSETATSLGDASGASLSTNRAPKRPSLSTSSDSVPDTEPSTTTSRKSKKLKRRSAPNSARAPTPKQAEAAASSSSSAKSKSPFHRSDGSRRKRSRRSAGDGSSGADDVDDGANRPHSRHRDLMAQFQALDTDDDLALRMAIEASREDAASSSDDNFDDDIDDDDDDFVLSGAHHTAEARPDVQAAASRRSPRKRRTAPSRPSKANKRSKKCDAKTKTPGPSVGDEGRSPTKGRRVSSSKSKSSTHQVSRTGRSASSSTATRTSEKSSSSDASKGPVAASIRNASAARSPCASSDSRSNSHGSPSARHVQGSKPSTAQPATAREISSKATCARAVAGSASDGLTSAKEKRSNAGAHSHARSDNSSRVGAEKQGYDRPGRIDTGQAVPALVTSRRERSSSTQNEQQNEQLPGENSRKTVSAGTRSVRHVRVENLPVETVQQSCGDEQGEKQVKSNSVARSRKSNADLSAHRNTEPPAAKSPKNTSNHKTSKHKNDERAQHPRHARPGEKSDNSISVTSKSNRRAGKLSEAAPAPTSANDEPGANSSPKGSQERSRSKNSSAVSGPRTTEAVSTRFVDPGAKIDRAASAFVGRERPDSFDDESSVHARASASVASDSNRACQTPAHKNGGVSSASDAPAAATGGHVASTPRSLARVPSAVLLAEACDSPDNARTANPAPWFGSTYSPEIPETQPPNRVQHHAAVSTSDASSSSRGRSAAPAPHMKPLSLQPEDSELERRPAQDERKVHFADDVEKTRGRRSSIDVTGDRSSSSKAATKSKRRHSTESSRECQHNRNRSHTRTPSSSRPPHSTSRLPTGEFDPRVRPNSSMTKSGVLSVPERNDPHQPLHAPKRSKGLDTVTKPSKSKNASQFDTASFVARGSVEDLHHLSYAQLEIEHRRILSNLSTNAARTRGAFDEAGQTAKQAADVMRESAENERAKLEASFAMSLSEKSQEIAALHEELRRTRQDLASSRSENAALRDQLGATQEQLDKIKSLFQ